LNADDENVFSDVWFHGFCALWPAKLMFFARKFPRLAKILKAAWKRKCVICKRIGATIPVESHTGFIHHPCAVKKNYRMTELTLTCKAPRSVLICRPIRPARSTS